MLSPKPKFSIVLCTYNGAAKIGKSLDSLLAQQLPSDLYEVIVVDDGSVDSTPQLLQKYPVKILTHPFKSGLAVARNTGLKHAAGDIVVCYDDDCTADPDWLSRLSTAFDDPHVLGAGGLVKLAPDSTLTDEYCFYSGYGSPLPLSLGNAHSIISRLISYLITSFSFPQSRYVDGTKVLELPGILSSFRKDKLVKVGGWNTNLKNIAEDTDLCRRLSLEFPRDYFVVIPSAKVVHEQKLSFDNFLKKEYFRGRIRKQYYSLKKQIPPYFPGPFVAIFLTLLAIVLKHPLFLIIIPFVIYPWWPIRAYTQKNLKLLLFSPLQMLHEGATVFGMLLSL